MILAYQPFFATMMHSVPTKLAASHTCTQKSILILLSWQISSINLDFSSFTDVYIGIIHRHNGTGTMARARWHRHNGIGTLAQGCRHGHTGTGTTSGVKVVT